MTEKFQTSAHPSSEEPNVQIHLRNLRANDDADKARLGVWCGMVYIEVRVMSMWQISG